MPCVAESRDWPVLEELLFFFSCKNKGGSSGAQEEVLRCGVASWHPKDHSREALSGCSPPPLPYPTPTDWPGGCQDSWRCKSSARNRKKGETSGVTVIFTLISFKEGKRKSTAVFPQSPMKHFILFPFVLLPGEQHHTHFQGIDIVHKRATFSVVFNVFPAPFLIYWIAVEAICSQ